MNKLFQSIALLLTLALPSVPSQAETLRIFSATDLDAIAPLLKQFEQQHPDLMIKYQEFNTQELYDELLTGQEPPDVVISSAADLQVKLVNDGFAQPIENVPDANIGQSWSQWADELFGFTYEPIVFVYNKKAFEGKTLPTTHEALAEQLRDQSDFYFQRVGSYDATKSGLGYLVASQDEVTFSLTGRLQDSMGRARAETHCCTSILLDKLTSGELVFGYNLLGSYAMAKALKNEHIAVIVPEDYALVIVRSAFVHRQAQNATAAAEFIRFLRSEQGQDIIAKQTALIPLNYRLGSINDPFNQINAPTSFHPIPLAPELLVYLDQQKRQHFIEAWSQAMGTTR